MKRITSQKSNYIEQKQRTCGLLLTWKIWKRLSIFLTLGFAKYNHTNDEYYVVASEYHPELQQSRPVFLHQFLVDAKGEPVDHENNDTLDNRKSNLRIVEDRHNSWNRKGRNANNTSGYRNVSWDGSAWIVQVQIDGKTRRVGRFKKDELELAAKCAEEMRQKYYGEFAGRG